MHQVTVDVVEHEAAEALLTVEAAIPEDGGWTVPGLSVLLFPLSAHETGSWTESCPDVWCSRSASFPDHRNLGLGVITTRKYS